VTVASDVKIQVEMNPVEVESYRLLGYENRLLRKEEFDDDKADAGEMGAGQTVTAFYEITPARRGQPTPAAAHLKYQADAPLTGAAHGGELMTLKVRYKPTAGAPSQLAVWPIRDDARAGIETTSRDFRFASAVVAFGLSLRASPHRGHATYAMARQLAEGALSADADPYRRELVALVNAAESLAAKR
jgi:Ca-activated chloride channel family protein